MQAIRLRIAIRGKQTSGSQTLWSRLGILESAFQYCRLAAKNRTEMEGRLTAMDLRGVAFHPFARAWPSTSAAPMVEATSSYGHTDFNPSDQGTAGLFQGLSSSIYGRDCSIPQEGDKSALDGVLHHAVWGKTR